MNELSSFVLIFPLILFITPIAAILRSEIVYWSMLLASLLFPWIAFEIVQNGLGDYNGTWFETTVSPTAVLLLYKLFDRIILKLFGRHLFITWRGHYLSMNEGWLDILLQVILIFSPVAWFWMGEAVFG